MRTVIRSIPGCGWANVRGDGTPILLHLDPFKLRMTPASFAESVSEQATPWLQHDANDDPCKALVSETLRFDLTPALELHREGGASFSTLIIPLKTNTLNSPTIAPAGIEVTTPQNLPIRVERDGTDAHHYARES